ncbi:Asp23/Gls24 family envelope stress response protein [Candidatus Contubernalis alkaliaceticus]|uniref:Asp23/Gls24 family envelope stress response protein n=1 Tax=Candidatus Contubernalis alkaliaceticus TaxID=338645 RepID=UPI001F4C0AFE|nr:Asp23/Gls24 family envelope stress response protein [Candidatus Contubernalis alkalaceticus]
MAENNQTSELGAIKIADEVVAIIAGLATAEVQGVAEMSGGFAGDIVDILKKKNLSKGVKVVVGETEAFINIFITVKYGIPIPSVAMEVQEKVIKAVEYMTGLKVSEINIQVQGVSFQKTEE